LETPAPLKPAVTLATGPRVRHDSRPWPPASRTHGAASAACRWRTTPQERGCSGAPARDVSADRRIRATRARGRGPGPAVVPGPGTYSAMEWAGAWRLLNRGRIAARAFGALGWRLKASGSTGRDPDETAAGSFVRPAGQDCRRQFRPASRTGMPAAVSSGQPDRNAGGCFVRPAGQECRRLFRPASRTGMPAAVSSGWRVMTRVYSRAAPPSRWSEREQLVD
jgi:hypothetical protein